MRCWAPTTAIWWATEEHLEAVRCYVVCDGPLTVGDRWDGYHRVNTRYLVGSLLPAGSVVGNVQVAFLCGPRHGQARGERASATGWATSWSRTR